MCQPKGLYMRIVTISLVFRLDQSHPSHLLELRSFSMQHPSYINAYGDIDLESTSNSKITHVNIYPNHAEVTRLFRVEVGINHTRVTLSGLPRVLHYGSLR